MYAEIRAVTAKCNDALDAVLDEIERTRTISDRTPAARYFMECCGEKKAVVRRCVALEEELLSKSETS